MLYEVAIVEVPTENERDDGKKEKLVLSPTPVIADNPQQAGIKATVGKTLDSDMDKIEVYVRPFGERSE